MCCICFANRGENELFVDAEGTKWDLCSEAINDCAAKAGMRNEGHNHARSEDPGQL